LLNDLISIEVEQIRPPVIIGLIGDSEEGPGGGDDEDSCAPVIPVIDGEAYTQIHSIHLM
jgi:hypothetical protein